VLDGAQWRWFRADRIMKVTDGGQNFLPRCQIQLSLEQVQQFTQERSNDAESKRAWDRQRPKTVEKQTGH